MVPGASVGTLPTDIVQVEGVSDAAAEGVTFGIGVAARLAVKAAAAFVAVEEGNHIATNDAEPPTAVLTQIWPQLPQFQGQL